ncbi:MAG: radical SAM family heme chaperone HemW [Halieaceae bacterium]|nr:radical SAM family heme chaperone HemW [Halieaceae bacterium]
MPWCESKCPYCDFNSHPLYDLPEADYIDCLLQDLEADLTKIQHRPIVSLFVGGGTPSLFSARSIQRLMDGVASRVELADDLEATMEANPGSAESSKFQGFRAAGINRLSLGVQSFQDTALQQLGRIHNSDEALVAIEMAQATGFDCVNIDLMHGLPGQSTLSAMADLSVALNQQPAHLSWYQLTIEPNTLFHRQPPTLPREEIMGDIEAQGLQQMKDAGLQQYEVSAYARPSYRCRHNLNYWSFGDYLGIGAGAHGKISFPEGRILRYTKKRQPDHYMGGCNSDYTAKIQELEPREVTGEFMMNALRLNRGFSLALFSSRTGLPAASIQRQLDTLQSKGLLEFDRDWVRATALGRRFLNDVVADFFTG